MVGRRARQDKECPWDYKLFKCYGVQALQACAISPFLSWTGQLALGHTHHRHLRSLDPISVSSSRLLTYAPVQIVKLLPTSLPPSHTCLPPTCTLLAPKPHCRGPTHGILRPAFSGHADTGYRCLLEHPFIDSLMTKLYTFMAQLKAWFRRGCFPASPYQTFSGLLASLPWP